MELRVGQIVGQGDVAVQHDNDAPHLALLSIRYNDQRRDHPPGKRDSLVSCLETATSESWRQRQTWINRLDDPPTKRDMENT
jgi:hypothetical protein